MIILTKNRITSLFILFIAFFLLYSNEQLNISHYDLLGSIFFPRIVCILIIILGVALFFIKDEKIENSQKQENNSYLSVVFFLFLSLIFLLALDYNLGFLISSFFYVLILTFMLNNYKFEDLLKIALFSLAFCYVIYAFFQNVLRLLLP